MNINKETQKQLSEMEKTKGQSYNAHDQDLIRQLIQSRMEQKSKLEFESLDGYEIPPRTQFSMLKKPAVSFKFKEMTFNMACIRLFEGVQHILPIVHKEKRRLAIVTCSEEESGSVEWARKKGDVWINKTIISLEFISKIYDMMNWNKDCRYKVLGRVAMSKKGPILVFDFPEAIMFSALPIEYVDKTTGEIKKRRVTYYPDEYKNRIGKSYNDYAASQQLNLFENLEEYIGKTYEDAVKTVSEANTDIDTAIQQSIQETITT